MSAKRPASRCVFCDIVAGAEKAAVVFRSEATLAFLDQRPLFPGHCLLVPLRHYETLADLPPEAVAPVFADVQLVARAVEEAMQAEGTLVAINNRVSQSVPHLHVHVVPRRRKDGLRGFFWPRQPYPDEAAREAVRQAIERVIARLQGQP
ncbi:MAG TPA: HIT family protein [Terriglobales bacterium]|nr:HIT family protein [Terriglobales bacterium]